VVKSTQAKPQNPDPNMTKEKRAGGEGGEHGSSGRARAWVQTQGK
jgi:hypothetical protein